MAKNRPYIAPPKMSPPELDGAQLVMSPSAAVEASVPAPAPAPVLAVVAAPPRIASVNIKADRIEFVNPLIDLAEWVWLKHVTPAIQTNKLAPALAVVAHGMLVIEELKLSIPVAGATFRT